VCETRDYIPDNVKIDEWSAVLMNMRVRFAADGSGHGLGAVGWVWVALNLILLGCNCLPVAGCCLVCNSVEFVANLKVRQGIC
jgi:hypothetical protein